MKVRFDPNRETEESLTKEIFSTDQTENVTENSVQYMVILTYNANTWSGTNPEVKVLKR